MPDRMNGNALGWNAARCAERCSKREAYAKDGLAKVVRVPSSGVP